jgi:hypothetical protein
MAESSKVELILIKAKLEVVECLLREMMEVIKPSQNIPGIREAVLRKQNPLLNSRFLRKVRKEKQIGIRFGRDIYYTENEVKSILEAVNEENQIKNAK